MKRSSGSSTESGGGSVSFSVVAVMGFKGRGGRGRRDIGRRREWNILDLYIFISCFGFPSIGVSGRSFLRKRVTVSGR